MLLDAAAWRLTPSFRLRRLGWPMKREGLPRHFILGFLIALVVYVIFYQGIEHRRTRRGPWQVTFTRSASDLPAIVINQPRLAITNVQICFAGVNLPPSTNVATLRFAQPRPVPYDLPFGKCVFMDTTFLPGTVTFDLFGHEIELLPRVLVIDRQEHPWLAGVTITLPAAQAAPTPAAH